MSNTTSKKWKLAQLSREFNVSLERIVEILKKEGYKGYKGRPNEKVPEDVVRKLAKHFGRDKKFKTQLEEVRTHEEELKNKESLSIEDIKKDEEVPVSSTEDTIFIKDTSTGSEIPVSKESIEIEKEQQPSQPAQEQTQTELQTETTTEQKTTGPKILGKIDLDKIEGKTGKKKKSTKSRDKQRPAKETKTKETAETKQPTDQTSEILKRAEEISNTIDQETKEKQAEEQTEQKTPAQTQETVEAAQATAEPEPVEQPQPETEKPQEQTEQIGLTVLGKIDLDKIEPPKTSSKGSRKKQHKSERKAKDSDQPKDFEQSKKPPKGKKGFKKGKKRRVERVDIEKEAKRIKDKQTKRKSAKEHIIIDQKEIDKSYRETIQQTTSKVGKSIAKKRQEKKKLKQKKLEELEQQQNKTLTITEFLTVGQLASLMGVDQIELLQKALSLGIKATVNYPLEADDIELLAGEYGYEVEFIDVTTLEELESEIQDNEKDLVPRPPIVTVMGHVDHGKTSLLDYIRNTNVVAGEAGGITQHIGAYHITLDDGRQITFIDTPGHEAFTAMRARGAKVTDIAVIVIAADDGVRPQTEEALDHAKAAGVPIIFAINKVDKETADPEKVRNQLAQRGYLVSSWGGDYFDIEISAKTGYNVDELLETILLVAEDLDLKANPKRPAIGTVLEASVEKGRGPVVNVLVRTGTLRVGDIVLAGSHYGRVRAMFNERMQKIKEAGPSIPAQILGLDGAPEPGEPFTVMESEKEAKQKANQRAQIKRVIARRKRKILTLEEISRRLQVGEFTEINIIIKADVQGTADALAEQLEKLSTDEVQVNIIRSSAGQISESDVMLAHVSKAIIIGFNVRPSAQVRKLAEQKEVEIRTYSVIYHAIEEIKSAIAGMLKPIVKEEHLGTAKVLKVFKIKGVGVVAGCQVEEGKITNDANVRVIRNGIVVYEGEIGSLKRYQEDVPEVKAPQECGLTIKNFNDIKKDDQIEAFKKIEIERKI